MKLNRYHCCSNAPFEWCGRIPNYPRCLRGSEKERKVVRQKGGEIEQESVASTTWHTDIFVLPKPKHAHVVMFCRSVFSLRIRVFVCVLAFGLCVHILKASRTQWQMSIEQRFCAFIIEQQQQHQQRKLLSERKNRFFDFSVFSAVHTFEMQYKTATARFNTSTHT